MKKFWDGIDKRRYKAFDRYLDQAESWRNKRAKKDARKYNNRFAHNYDDRLQNQYLNFQNNQFQLLFTILTIIGMLVSGMLSGYFVYYVTKDRIPLIVISEPKYNVTERVLDISVSNFRDYPTHDVLVYYRILGLEDGGRYIGVFPSLFRETKNLTLNVSEIDTIIIRKSEEWFLSYYKENNSVGIQEDKDYIISFLGFNADYNLQILVSCGRCDTTLPEPINYNPNIYCKIEEAIPKCKILGSSGL